MSALFLGESVVAGGSASACHIDWQMESIALQKESKERLDTAQLDDKKQKGSEEDKDYYEKASRYRREVMQVMIGAGFRVSDINSAQGSNVTVIYNALSENKDKGSFIRHLLAIFKFADGGIAEFLSYTNEVDLIGKAVKMWDLYQGDGVKIMYYVFRTYHVSDYLAKEWAIYVGDLVGHN